MPEARELNRVASVPAAAQALTHAGPVQQMELDSRPSLSGEAFHGLSYPMLRYSGLVPQCQVPGYQGESDRVWYVIRKLHAVAATCRWRGLVILRTGGKQGDSETGRGDRV